MQGTCNSASTNTYSLPLLFSKLLQLSKEDLLIIVGSEPLIINIPFFLNLEYFFVVSYCYDPPWSSSSLRYHEVNKKDTEEFKFSFHQNDRFIPS